MVNSHITYSKKHPPRGFTLMELIVYIAIVSIILVSLTYLILDIIGGQTHSDASLEINQNLRFITRNLVSDIHAAQTVSSLVADTLILATPGGQVTYHFDSGDKKITRQVDAGNPIDLSSDEIEVGGSFSDQSFSDRNKTVGVVLNISYKNPSNRSDFNATTSAIFSVELRGRR